MNTNQFTGFCALAKKVVSKNLSLPPLQSVLIKDGRIYASNLEIIVSRAIENLEGEFCIEFQDFCAFVEKFKNLEFEWSYSIGQKSGFSKQSSVVIDTRGKGRFTFTGCAPEDFPSVAFEGSGIIDRLSDKDVSDIKKAVNYVPNDELRPVMTTVLVSDHIVASDFHVLSFYKRDVKGSEPWLLPNKVVSIMGDTKGIFYYVYKSVDGKYIKLNRLNDDIVFRAFDGKYPVWESIIPTDFNMGITINSDFINESLSCCAMVSKNGGRLVRFEISGGMLKISSKNTDLGKSWENSGELESFEYVGEGMSIGFDIDLLSKIMRIEKFTGGVGFMIVDPSRAVIINGNVLLMPIIING